jgi:hypothetical protein
MLTTIWYTPVSVFQVGMVYGAIFMINGPESLLTIASFS